MANSVSNSIKIDAHQHFWETRRDDYGWLTLDQGKIYRDFLPANLKPILDKEGIHGTVLVQAAPTVAETEYLLGLADVHSFVFGVVGWVNFESERAPETISGLAKHPKLKGLRPMIQDITDPSWILKPDLGPAIDALEANGLTFDALVKPEHLQELDQFLKNRPDLKVVIDHAAKPNIAFHHFTEWARDIAKCAAYPNVSCKLSGLVTEAKLNWIIADLRPYVEHLLKLFGPERLIWGSDWPVCTLASDYQRWLATSRELLGNLGSVERAAIFGRNAIEFYGLEVGVDAHNG